MITLPRWRLASAAACLASLVGIPARAQAQVSTYEQLQSFSSVLSQVRANYVDSVNVGSLVRAAIVGMLRSLDPHSRYQAREDFELEARFDAGHLAAGGLSVEDADGAPVVLTVVPGGAAAPATACARCTTAPSPGLAPAPSRSGSWASAAPGSASRSSGARAGSPIPSS